VIVEWMVTRGPRSDARRCERRAAIGILLERGQLSYRRIAEQVGVTKRTVERVAAKKRERAL
jgi:transposase